MHQLMRELLTLVPKDDAPWPAEARARWMAAFAAVADVVYEDGHLFGPVPAAATYADPPPQAAYVGPVAAPDLGQLDISALEQRPSLDLRVDHAVPATGRARHRRPAK